MSLDLVHGSLRYSSEQPLEHLTIDGVPVVSVARIGVCHACGGKRLRHAAPHAPHFNSRNELVDCVGQLLERGGSR